MKNKLLTVLFTFALAGVLLVPATAQAAPARTSVCTRCQALSLGNGVCGQHANALVCQKPSCPSNPCKPNRPCTPDQPTPPPTEKPEQPVLPDVPEQPDDTTGSVQAYERQVAELVNKERAANGLKPLQLSAKLSHGARKKSQDMKTNNYFDHNSPTYGSPYDMMASLGITYSAAGENIAMGQRTPQAVMTAWMNSAGHRANILSPKFTGIGVGYVAGGNYWTQWFIG